MMILKMKKQDGDTDRGGSDDYNLKLSRGRTGVFNRALLG
jgi:outer membrane protein OmpA-like peptidoglycan-associated protein